MLRDSFPISPDSHPLGYPLSRPLSPASRTLPTPITPEFPPLVPLHSIPFFSPLYLLGVDWHWYRLDNNGQWSHKPGSTSVTDTDNIGNVITDPRVCAMGLYQFVTFMTADRTTVTIGGQRSCFLQLLSHACPCLGL